MKMYEKMGINPATQEGFAKLIDMSCTDIPDGKIYANCPYSSCGECLSKRLFAEVPTKKVKRWEIYNGDFLKAYKDFEEENCPMVVCPYNTNECTICFAEWLITEIEVEE